MANEAETHLRTRPSEFVTHAKGLTMIQPTIGRIVLYHPNPSGGDPAPIFPELPYAAVLAGIDGQGLLSLGVFDHFGRHFPRSRVRLAQDSDIVERGMAEWMMDGLDLRLSEIEDAMSTPAESPPKMPPVPKGAEDLIKRGIAPGDQPHDHESPHSPDDEGSGP